MACVVTLLFSGWANAQTQTFVKQIAHSSHIQLAECIRTENNDFVLLQVAAAGLGAGQSEIVVTKLSSNADLIWSRTYGTGTFDQSGNIEKTRDGGFIITGSTIVNNPVFQGLVLKLDSTGNIEWSKSYESDYNNDLAIDIAELPNGDLMLLFNTDTPSILKLDATGNLIWARQYFSSQESISPISMKSANDGSVVLNTYRPGQLEGKTYLISIDTSGAVLWSKSYLATSSHLILDQTRTQSGNWMLFGPPGVLFTTDSMGNLLSANRYDSLGYIFSATALDSNQFFLSGSSASVPPKSVVMKIDRLGTPLQTMVYSPTAYNVAQQAYSLKDTSRLIFGTENQFMSGLTRSVLIMKTDSAGFTGCEDTSISSGLTNWPLIVQSETILTNQLNSITVTPLTFQTGASPGLTQVCPPTNVDGIKLDETAFRLYPNPTTGMLHLESVNTINTITIYNSFGQTILSQHINTKEASFNLNSQPSGLYFYRLNTTTGTQHIGRIVLQ